MGLEQLRDVPHLLQVLTDSGRPTDVRIDALRRLRNGPLAGDDRSTVADALRQLTSTGSYLDLRLQAVVALGEFTDIPGVLSALGSLAMQPEESIDLRYSAFTSLECAGPTPGCVNLLRELSDDDLLGNSVRSAMARWRID
jgi:hypothetical protein